MAFAYSPKIVTDGLVFAVDAANTKSYPGSGTTWSDLSGNGNNSTLINGPTYNSANGGSIVFDGVNDFARPTTALNITGGAGTAQTYDIWFNADSLASSQALFGWDSYNYVGVFATTGETFIATNGDNSIGDFTTTPTASAGTWHNVIIVFDQGTAYKLWLNGVSYGSAVTTDTSPVSTERALIGARYATGTTIDFYFNGKISNVKAYNRELTSTETLQNYNALKSRFGL